MTTTREDPLPTTFVVSGALKESAIAFNRSGASGAYGTSSGFWDD